MQSYIKYGQCGGNEGCGPLTYNSEWTAIVKLFAEPSWFSRVLSHSPNHTHSFTSRWLLPCKVLSIPIGSSWGSVFCPRLLQGQNLNCQPFDFQFTACFTNSDETSVLPQLANYTTTCPPMSVKMQWPLGKKRLWEYFISLSGIFKMVFWWNHHQC